MSSFFHYTDAAGLIGIVSSDSLYATDYRYLNDSTEGGLIRNYIMPIFEAEDATISRELVKQGFLRSNYYEELGNRANQLEAESQYRSLVKGFDNVSPFFVVSFCRHAANSYEYQHGLLSQWRAYADSAGFAIEFDETELDKQAALELKNFAYVGYRSDDVVYEAHDKKFIAEDYKGVAGEMVRLVFESVGKDVSKVTGRKNANEVLLKYAQTAPFLKHRSFREEAEYRMVFVCLRASKIPDGEERSIKEIKVRQKAGLLIPYIELFGTENMSAAVKSIIVGPHPLQDKQEEAAKMFLESEALEVPVRKSEIPYRK